ncbi:MAG: FAD-dependent oxidoreductase [Bacilli bacterium]
MKDFDAVIIGFGKGGKTLAGYLAKQGKKVAIIEKDKNMYGGTCINVGCIPSKALVTSSRYAKVNPTWAFSKKTAYYDVSIQEKNEITSFLRDKNYHKLADNSNIEVFDGIGSFVSKNEVKVVSKEKEEILHSELIFINTGSRPYLPKIKGIENNPHVFISETMLNVTRLPRKLTIIGAGYISMEFASMYANFGTKVTVLQDGPTFLPKEDRDVALAIKANLEKQGVRIIPSALISEITNKTVYYTVNGKHSTVTGEDILLATGRRPNIQELDLEKAGIELTERGAIKVNEHLETNVKGIFALGDVNGGPQFTFVSLDDFRIVRDYLENKNQGHTLLTRQAIPYSVFMDTPLARVGLSEDQAKAKNIPYVVKKIMTNTIPKARVLRETNGFLKALVDPETKQILGAALLCAESYEIINTISLAMSLKVPYTYLADFIYTHPTMSESFNDLFA